MVRIIDPKGPADAGLFRFVRTTRAFHFYLESVEMLSVFVFAAKRMVKVMPL